MSVAQVSSRAAGEQARHEADVLVVGAGPAGSAAAFWLASAGHRVALLEKATFPRDKVCGDGLTPRGVASLLAMGVDVSEEAGWLRNRGLRVIGGGLRLELPWPQLSAWPDFGLVRPRRDLDELLVRRAGAAGAELHEGTTVTGPVLSDDGRVVGVRAHVGRDREPHEWRAPVVVAADGGSARLALAMGLRRREDRPLGVAYRQYFTSPRTSDDHLESWLELRDADDPDRLLPGYGWVFGLGDGTVNVGLGILSSSEAFQSVDYRALLRRWISSMPQDYGIDVDEGLSVVRGGALPMGFNRTPHHSRGVLLVGDAGGVVNPMNGEGIAYAMESGRTAADVVSQALGRPAGAARDAALDAYPAALKADYGGYYTLGRVFVELIGNPHVMRLATQRGLSHPYLMRFVLKLLANLHEPRGGDAHDRVISALTRLAPAA